MDVGYLWMSLQKFRNYEVIGWSHLWLMSWNTLFVEPYLDSQRMIRARQMIRAEPKEPKINQAVLKAEARVSKQNHFNEEGLVMGVIYGKGVESSAIKLEAAALNAIIDAKGPNAEVEVELQGVTMKGFIKEVKRSVMGQAVTHVDIQIVG